ncbi:agouti-related protein [Scyliorhinus canicula]|uniref:agouti-related protein n=1 Tax=Scyliorhinus canicula TaxID=7830 RepID=UPI0018F65E57|nr:agouti-related protein [Scyliorhinus canicula]
MVHTNMDQVEQYPGDFPGHWRSLGGQGIMFRVVLLCWSLQMVQVVLTRTAENELDLTLMPNDAPYSDLALLSRVQTLLPAAGPLSSPALDGAVGSVQEDRVSENIMLEPQVISNALEIERSERSPRRCVRHLESCFGHTLPCCDPCAICYCRFFNAICYCRKIGNSCHQGKS